MEKFQCHDCGKTLQGNEEYMPYQIGEQAYVKCKECHQKDPILKNFQRTEVYSRVVGFLRPVQQWNNGKKEEFKDRAEYVVAGSCC